MSDKLDLIETIAGVEKFSEFSRLMGLSGANEVFSRGGDFTLFAPTNDAFQQIAEQEMKYLLREENRPQLKSMLKYHVLPGRINADDAAALRRTVNISGQDVRFTSRDCIRINGAALLDRDLEASNGLVHAIDAVLVPSRNED
ncbi:MAG: fasciclin domain-containing protein [Pyrinomonadaceae bacterium]